MSARPSIDSIFCSAIEIESPDERRALVERACGDDADLQQQVERLLHAHFHGRSILDAPVQPVATVDEPLRETAGAVIGPYKLLEQIGEGGFGVVFMAEQTQPVRRKVALKVLKPGMDTRQVVARFEAERQALALMDHPNIARVLDGGQTGSGRPYFVMDLVKGLPITEYCDQAQFTPRERLELFVHLCQAVQHAHQKGVIHRDLKPSNVLVTVHDTVPVVKVIDFGVAKALGQELTDKTLFTGFAQMIGTPLYMSPEQAGQSGVDVDTRSDIYSLGVLLYELLTSTTPFERDRLKEVSYDELRRIIREEEPPRPSTRISTLGQAATSVSMQRKSDPKRLSQLCRGELDWIVMKCLEKDRNRRYETASALAADVQRYLNDEPVLACPPSAWYRFRKFARRKKTALVIAACVFLALAGITGGIGWAVRDRTAQEERIEAERRVREEALDQTVETILNDTGSLIDQGKWPEALAAVQRADKLLEVAGRAERPTRLLELRKELTMAERLEHIYRQPVGELKAKLPIPGQAIVQASGNEHEYSQIRPVLQKGRVWFRFIMKSYAVRGREQDAEFAKAFCDFGIDIDSLAPAEAAARIRCRSIRLALVKALDDWAPMRMQAHPDNDSGWKKLVQIARQADPDDLRNRCRDALLRRDRQALEQLADAMPSRQVPPATLYLLGHTLREVGAVDKAMSLLRRAQHEYPDDLWINDALAWHSLSAFQPPRYDDALRYYTAVLALRPRLAPAHIRVAHILEEKGALEETIAEYSKVIELEPTNHWARVFRGWNYHDLRQDDKAMADFSTAIDLDPKNAVLWDNRGMAYANLRRYDKAIADHSKAIELNATLAIAWSNRAAARHGLGEYGKAIADFSKAVELDPKDPLAWGNRAAAFCELHEYDKAIADGSKAIDLDPKYAVAWHNRGIAYTWLHQYDKAIPDYSKAIDLDPKIAHFWASRGWAYGELHQYKRAIADCSKAIELDPKVAGVWSNRGGAYKELHEYDKAIADCSKAIDLDPECAEAWSNRGNAYQDLHQYDKAIADHVRAVRLAPKDAAILRNRGVTYTAMRQYDKAFADLNKAIDLGPKDPLNWYWRGDAYIKFHQYDKAIADCSKAIELDPKLAVAWSNRGHAYIELHQYDKAIANLNKAIDLDPKNAVGWSNRGWAYRELHEYDQAIANLNKAIDLDPKNAVAWNNRGATYNEMRQYDKAIADLNKAIKLDPNNADFWLNRGWAYHELRQYDKAIADYSKAIELDPESTLAWNNRGAAYNHMRQFEKAIPDWNKLIELDPKRAAAWSSRGFAYFGLGQYDKAIADYSMAIEQDRTYARAWSNRGRAYVELRHYDKAIPDLSEAIKLDAKDVFAWRNRGSARFHLRQYDKAIADFSQAIELDPKHARTWSNRGGAYNGMQQYDKAIADVNQAIKLAAKDVLAWHNRGCAYHALHQYDQAIADFSRAIELDPKNVTHWEDRAFAYAALKQWDKGIADLSKAIELNPERVNLYVFRAQMHLGAGNRDGYRKACADMLNRFAKTEDPVTAQWVAWTCALAPEAVADPAKPVELAQKALAKNPNNRLYLLTLAAALYRAGRFEEAAKTLSEANAAKLDPVGTAVYTSLFLAMSHQRLGHAEQARQWLDKAVQAIDQAAKEPAKSEAGPSGKGSETGAGPPLPWFRRLAFQLLRREAEELVGMKKQKE
jgi:tetratricopeptide (TPR) repeat protein